MAKKKGNNQANKQPSKQRKIKTTYKVWDNDQMDMLEKLKQQMGGDSKETKPKWKKKFKRNDKNYQAKKKIKIESKIEDNKSKTKGDE